jgi:hypothetical protein
VDPRLRLVRIGRRRGTRGGGGAGNHIRPMLGILLLLWQVARRCRWIGRSNLVLWILLLLVWLHGPDPPWHHDDSLGGRRGFKMHLRGSHIVFANVRDDRSPLAFGVTPAREAESAGGMTKVPKAW